MGIEISKASPCSVFLYHRRRAEYVSAAAFPFTGYIVVIEFGFDIH